MKVHKQNQILSPFSNDQELIHQSKHLLLELYNCDFEKLNDESFLRCTLNRAAKLANATVLNLISNKFEPQGVTAIALLAESHISIHTWPESNYSAVDIFTCGQNMMPELASQYLIESLMAKEHSLRVIERNPPSAVSKQDIRDISKALGFPWWDKPAQPCLSSRFPYGHEITSERLKMVEKAEEYVLFCFLNHF